MVWWIFAVIQLYKSVVLMICPFIWDSFFLILGFFGIFDDALLLDSFLLTLFSMGKCCDCGHSLLIKFWTPLCLMGLLTGCIFHSHCRTRWTSLLHSLLRPIIRRFLILQLLWLCRLHHSWHIHLLDIWLLILNLSHNNIFLRSFNLGFVVASLFFDWVLARTNF